MKVLEYKCVLIANAIIDYTPESFHMCTIKVMLVPKLCS